MAAVNRIARHLADLLDAKGIPVQQWDARQITEPLNLAGYSAAIFAASVHLGRHEREMVVFAKSHHLTSYHGLGHDLFNQHWTLLGADVSKAFAKRRTPKGRDGRPAGDSLIIEFKHLIGYLKGLRVRAF